MHSVYQLARVNQYKEENIKYHQQHKYNTVAKRSPVIMHFKPDLAQFVIFIFT